ncbi:hypothetical protein JC607_22875 [Paracoccus sp. IB05]|nr:hypothetical protein [Paracoccus sp. IB05]
MTKLRWAEITALHQVKKLQLQLVAQDDRKILLFPCHLGKRDFLEVLRAKRPDLAGHIPERF